MLLIILLLKVDKKQNQKAKGKAVKNDTKKVIAYQMKLYSKLPDGSKPTQVIKHPESSLTSIIYFFLQ